MDHHRNSYTYVGSFFEDTINGKGVLTNSPRELRYEGEFKDGRMHGKFTYYWTDDEFIKDTYWINGEQKKDP